MVYWVQNVQAVQVVQNVWNDLKRLLPSMVFLCLTLTVAQSASAAAPQAPLTKAKLDAEAKGYLFISSHDAIVSEAKKEAKLRVLTGLDPDSIKAMTSAFKKKYPFIDLFAKEAAGIDDHQRIILELKAGTNKEWDVITMANDLYNQYPPYQKKFDILAMAEQGIVQIHPKMIDPQNRNIAAVTANIRLQQESHCCGKNTRYLGGLPETRVQGEEIRGGRQAH